MEYTLIIKLNSDIAWVQQKKDNKKCRILTDGPYTRIDINKEQANVIAGNLFSFITKIPVGPLKG